jgi:hypothetical protein
MANLNKAKNDIALSADSAVKVIANAANEASKTIASAAAEALKVSNTQKNNDHDLIIEIKTIQQTMLSEIREIKDGTAKRISDLEACKLDIKDSYPVLYKEGVEKALKDHEDRLRLNETHVTRIMTWGTAALVLIGILEFVIGKYF